MEQIFAKLIAKATGIGERQVANTIGLLEEGCTIPFISRYRKEVTGTLDEVQVANISDNLDKLKELAKRKETILKTIEEQGKMNCTTVSTTHGTVRNSKTSTCPSNLKGKHARKLQGRRDSTLSLPSS